MGVENITHDVFKGVEFPVEGRVERVVQIPIQNSLLLSGE